MKEFCDLVLKGGITSGVIYPRLIAQLASRYDFKNIGGTSAGAIAASACAAAQYGVRHGNPQAFDTLAGLPAWLSEQSAPGGRSRLFGMFQPADAVRRHFAVMVGALNARQPSDAAWAVLAGLLRMYAVRLALALVAGGLLLWPMVAALATSLSAGAAAATAVGVMLLLAGGAALGLRSALRGRLAVAAGCGVALWAVAVLVLMGVRGHAAGWWAVGSGALGMVVVALLVMAALVVCAAACFARSLLAGLHRNGYGLCSGLAPDGTPDTAPQSLTAWLAEYLNTLAGLPAQGAPLCFSHLWGHRQLQGPRDIHLEVMTSAVSQQMVYGIPFRPGTPPFYYDPDEWARLFPRAVMQHLEQAPLEEAATPEEAALAVEATNGKALRRLPAAADLPVVVAVRMSLSFPLLLSAVPLYAVDWSLADNARRKEERRPVRAKRVWFSDGGIGSNMPLHLFDSLLPRHPTFAVNLKPEHPDHRIQEPERGGNDGGRVYLPTNNEAGRQRYWREPNDAAPLGGLAGFFLGIVNTMQNWRDEIMFPYPGFRDRIIQISQRPDEGGLNLDMPPDRIQAMGHAGEMAADRLIDRFHPQGGQAGQGWRAHQEARLTSFLGTFQPASMALHPSLKQGVWSAVVEGLQTYGPQERAVAQAFLQGVEELGDAGIQSGVSLDKHAPKPLAQVRIAPRI